MKKLNENIQERESKISQMSALVDRITEENRAKSETETKLWNDLDAEVKVLDENIVMLERQEALNKSRAKDILAKKVETSSDEKPVGERFRSWLQDAAKGKYEGAFTVETRANPIITTTDTGIIGKIIRPEGIDVLVSPGEAFLRALGVQFYTGLNGNFTMPSMAENTPGFVGENADGSTASMSPSSVTLAPRRVTTSQAITKETLEQTNPGVYATIVQNLVDGIGYALINDFFTQFELDAASQVTGRAALSSPVTNADVLNIEASVGCYILGRPAYVSDCVTKAYLKGTAGLTNQVPMWQGNELNGYPAFGVPSAKNDRLYFGDWSKSAVGQWGSVDLIVDPFTSAASGKIVVTATGLYDSGVINKRAYTWMGDCSTR